VRVEALVPGAAWLQLAEGVPLLRPDEQVFAAMLEAWRHAGGIWNRYAAPGADPRIHGR